MEPFTTFTGRMMPLMRPNIDTDQIIPTEFLKRIERTGFGRYLFHDWAHLDDGSPDGSFVLNQSEYQGASVLVTGPNFGSGSSREHAPWALQDWGFKAIVAPSFADIFLSNCHKIGLLPVPLSDSETHDLADLAEADPSAEVLIDLEAQTVTAPGMTASFEIDPSVKWALLHGLDEIGRTLESTSLIAAYEQGRPSFMPVLTQHKHDKLER
jgi:3-isopropylmalate/(R)-2-methylmalate dehydratase small subunit